MTHHKHRKDVSLGDKIEGHAEHAYGHMKEGLGHALGNKQMEREGHAKKEEGTFTARHGDID